MKFIDDPEMEIEILRKARSGDPQASLLVEKMRESEYPDYLPEQSFLKGATVGLASDMIPGFEEAYIRGFGPTAKSALKGFRSGAMDASEFLGRLLSAEKFMGVPAQGQGQPPDLPSK